MGMLISYYQYLSHINYSLLTVHGFEQLSYTTNESEALQGINFRPNVKGTGQPVNIGIIAGTIDLEEDMASKLFPIEIFL